MDTITQKQFNQSVAHPLQSYEWGAFREKLGTKIIRIMSPSEKEPSLTMSLHKIPHTPLFAGYIPKSHNVPAQKLLDIADIGRKNNAIFIQLEPNLLDKKKEEFQKEVKKSKLNIRPSAHPLFTKYTFVLDLAPSEEELLKNMHPKTRYNIRVAQKHGVTIREDNSDKAFKTYLKLTDETTQRQKFYAHTPHYHKTLWQTLEHQRNSSNENALTSHLFTANYKGKILATWIVFVFKDTIYYPYGASSSESRHVMASNLMMWEVIRFAKKNNLHYFDMWGALGPSAHTNDPWYGFHKFKQGYGPVLTEFIGSYDIVLNPFLYWLYMGADKFRWSLLKILKR